MTESKLKNKLFEFQKLWLKFERNAKGYNYKYTSYDFIREKIEKTLNEWMLLVTHKIQDYGGNLFLETTITDMESDETITSQISISATSPQTMWSAITYFKRYNLGALLNLIIEWEDDDGASAEKKTSSKPKFSETNFENFKKYAEWKTKDEMIEKKEIIMAKYAVSDEMNEKIDNFLSSL